ncbi:oligopeptide transporter 4-like isoform X2 [Phragmites australis]|uniref:oligopeptide transporter 4-like isoform X2 n=1 Tax=Phragmites australis TaxID=29695 RepID=UPI002D771C7F|nr:oligopeptide transporter 4-like isoform X2 [Phragmites australis]
MGEIAADERGLAAGGEGETEESPIEEVRLTVPSTDDPSLPVWTFRMWSIGLVSCALMGFLNQFFSYRTEPLVVTQITVQVASLPVGHFMARVLPRRRFRAPALLGGGEWSLNPGPFNMKEHVLISIFANAGFAFGVGNAYAVFVIDIIRAFYHRHISFFTAWLLVITTQVLGYGWAGLLRKYVVEPSHMWWPSTLVQVSLFRALHEKEEFPKGSRQISRSKFFLVALICSFAWYAVPGYLFPTLTSISWVCWVFSKSVTAQQLGSGMKGLGLGAFTLDWSTVSSFLFSPLISPFFATVNIFVGYAFFVYVVMPTAYWGLNLYNAKTFPIFSSHLFMSNGTEYDIQAIVNNNFEIDMDAYNKIGKVNLSIFFALTYGLSFATIAATITHVGLFYGKEIYYRFRASQKEEPDIHTKLMKRYDDIPGWWFYSLMALSMTVSLLLCTILRHEVQLPWWGLLFACGMAFIFTLPISIISATTNQTPGLNVITEYAMGLIMPGYPIANVCFKVYGYMSMSQAVSFLSDFKLGHYMKIPPKSMFLVQFVGTIVAGTVNIGVAWWLLGSIKDICSENLAADSPWTCPSDRVFFDASVIWGLVGPRHIFGSRGNYGALNWFFLIGAAGPIIVYALHRAFPGQRWIPLINLPVLLGATASMPPATAVNYNSWLIIGTVFNFFVFRYRKTWWTRYNYVLSAALDAGVAFMGVLLYFSLTMENRSIDWWGTAGEHCPLASCPTAKGVGLGSDSVCPVF